MLYVVLLCPTWDSVRTQLTAWAEPTLAVLGILTLLGAVWSWSERWRTVNLQVARRARRVLRILDEWRQYPATIADVNVDRGLRANAWRDRVVKGENEVQSLLEQMLDLAGGAGPLIRRATRKAYRLFLIGSDLIHKFGQPELTGHSSFVDQATDAAKHFADARQVLAKIVPHGLL